MKFVRLGKDDVAYPEKWNELSQKQVISIFELLEKEELTASQYAYKFFKILTGVSWWKMYRCIEDVEASLDISSWLFEKEDDNRLTNPIIKCFKGRYSPSALFSNVIVSEFFWALFYYKQYHTTKEPKNLDMMISILFRNKKEGYNMRKNPNGDCRVEFNMEMVQYDSKYISKWPLSVKLAINKFFEDTYLTLKDRYWEAFEGGDGSASRFEFYPVIASVAQRGNHGTFEKVERINIHLFFMECVEVIVSDKSRK